MLALMVGRIGGRAKTLVAFFERLEFPGACGARVPRVTADLATILRQAGGGRAPHPRRCAAGYASNTWRLRRRAQSGGWSSRLGPPWPSDHGDRLSVAATLDSADAPEARPLGDFGQRGGALFTSSTTRPRSTSMGSRA